MTPDDYPEEELVDVAFDRRTGEVAVVVTFDQPVTAEEMQERFQTLADALDDAVGDDGEAAAGGGESDA